MCTSERVRGTAALGITRMPDWHRCLLGEAMCPGSTSKTSTGKTYRFYRCSKRDKYGKDQCASKPLPAPALEEFVVARITEASAGAMLAEQHLATLTAGKDLDFAKLRAQLAKSVAECGQRGTGAEEDSARLQGHRGAALPAQGAQRSAQLRRRPREARARAPARQRGSTARPRASPAARHRPGRRCRQSCLGAQAGADPREGHPAPRPPLARGRSSGAGARPRSRRRRRADGGADAPGSGSRGHVGGAVGGVEQTAT